MIESFLALFIVCYTVSILSDSHLDQDIKDVEARRKKRTLIESNAFYRAPTRPRYR